MFKRAFFTLTEMQLKLYLREPIAFFFTLVFPLLLLLLFGAIFGNTPDPQFNPHQGYIDYETPALIVLILATIGLMSVPIKVAAEREQKILRRYQATPLKPLVYLSAEITTNILVALAGTFLLLFFGWLIYNLQLPQQVGMVFLAWVLSTLTFAAMGFLIAALAPTARIAQVVGMVLFFTMMFLSGAALPPQLFPEWLQQARLVFPMTHAVNLLQGLWFGEAWSLHWLAMSILALTLVLCAALAARYFRWE